MKLPKGAEEKLISERNGLLLSIGYYSYGDPKNRITVREKNNPDPTKDLVFCVYIVENKLVLQYPLYFKLEKMLPVLQIIWDYEKFLIESGKEIWKF